MLFLNGRLQLSGSDLIGHLNCGHLTQLEASVARGTLPRHYQHDPLLQILRERGMEHERSYVEHLRAAGLSIQEIEGVGVTDDLVAQTIEAMASGVQVIAQGAFIHGSWSGRTDILRRVETPSRFGDWSYEVIDTKLASTTKGATVLQLSLYSELLENAQGALPENMHVVTPWTDFAPETYRLADYAAYYRLVKTRLEGKVVPEDGMETYPEPKTHCEICHWRVPCDARRREDDHLYLVAGISKAQIHELNTQGVNTTAQLAALPSPISWRPERGSVSTYERLREQARIQVDGREAGRPIFEALPIEPGFGLCRLPEPSPGDVFFDLEGDPFIGQGGMEYLFGYVVINDAEEPQQHADWVLNREEERQAFERFVDFVMERWEAYPGMHVYHYAPYEPGALKRLMGRYATREEEIDRMLRAGLFVDLYGVVRQGVLASVESYSIKKMEAFYGFERATELGDANIALTQVQAALELGDAAEITAELRDVVTSYNRDDCVSTFELRRWLEAIRQDVVNGGQDVPRPAGGDGTPGENISEWQQRLNALVERLTDGIPADIADRTTEQQAVWVLANILDWHRREDKAAWWEYFRLNDLPEDELLEEADALAGLAFIGSAGGTAKAPVHRYRFPMQETDFRGGESLHIADRRPYGKVETIDTEARTVDIKKRGDTADMHATSAFAHDMVNTKELTESLFRIGEYVAEHGITGEGLYQAARDLLLRIPPRIGEGHLRLPDESVLDSACRIGGVMEGGVLPIQGPPGAGKTYTGGRMIAELVRSGQKVGITANSHKVIRNLLDSVVEAAEELGVALTCIQKAKEKEDDTASLVFAKSNDDVFSALNGRCQVAGGTAWLWAREDARDSVDVLFVDEAAQMSLANVLAVSQAARSVVLLGDPQQLNQPMKGSHPEGTDVSALDHILGGHQTIEADRGLFLEQTWRLHPDICRFTSELFYENRLNPRNGLEVQRVNSTGIVQGSGLRFMAVDHSGNQSSSREEAEAVESLVRNILGSGSTWVDSRGVVRPVTLDDILIIAPYNAQVFEIKARLPEARVGTVDKFQGQEAPIAIYSMTTSSHTDAPRGMEFLYSLNRLNVASSRAKCISIIVGSPKLFEAECRTPRQIQLANAFCRYLELADLIRPHSP